MHRDELLAVGRAHRRAVGAVPLATTAISIAASEIAVVALGGGGPVGRNVRRPQGIGPQGRHPAASSGVGVRVP